MIFAQDTLPETREVLLRLWRAKTEEERLIHGFRLWNSVKNRIMSAIISEQPGIVQGELLVETFKRIYREDFSVEETARICARIREYHCATKEGNNTVDLTRSAA